MPIEIKEAVAEYLLKVDQLLPTALDGGSNTIVVATSEEQILGAGLIETLPRNKRESCLCIEIAAPNEQIRQALIEHLSELARSWGAESIELGPAVILEGHQATFRSQLGFEPKDESETWTLDLPLKGDSLPERESEKAVGWSAGIPNTTQLAQIMALFQSNPLVARQAPTVAKLIPNPETLSLSRILLEEDTDEPGTPRMTAALVFSRTETRGFPYFTTVAGVSDELARLRFLAQDASASWEAAKVQSMLLIRPVASKPGPLVMFAQENGATVASRHARWVKLLSS